MLKLVIFALLLFTASAMPRSPRIYNVLISSKKNLSPSHAQPVYEPVLRTTSVGYAFPTLFYHSTFVQGLPLSYVSKCVVMKLIITNLNYFLFKSGFLD